MLEVSERLGKEACAGDFGEVGGKIESIKCLNASHKALLLCGAYKKRVTLFGSTKHNPTCLGNTKTPPAALSSDNKKP